MADAGIVAAVQAALGSGGLKADVFDRCGPEAPVSSLEEVSAKAREGGYDLLIGVGGGSVMDLTKAAGLLAANPDATIQDLIEGRPPAKSLEQDPHPHYRRHRVGVEHGRSVHHRHQR